MSQYVPEEILQASRPVDPQVDVRTLLSALAGAWQAPQTSYFGLTPEDVQSSAGQQLQRQAQAMGMLQDAQKMAVAQEQQSFADALNAKKMQFTEQELAMQQAMNALRMQEIRQSMGLRAASEGRAAEAAALANELARLKLGFAKENPNAVFGTKGRGMTAAEMKLMQSLGLVGKSFTSEADRQRAASLLGDIQKFGKAVSDFQAKPGEFGTAKTPEDVANYSNSLFSTTLGRYANSFENPKEFESFVMGGIAPLAPTAPQAPGVGEGGALPSSGGTPPPNPTLVQKFLNGLGSQQKAQPSEEDMNALRKAWGY